MWTQQRGFDPAAMRGFVPGRKGKRHCGPSILCCTSLKITAPVTHPYYLKLSGRQNLPLSQPPYITEHQLCCCRETVVRCWEEGGALDVFSNRHERQRMCSLRPSVAAGWLNIAAQLSGSKQALVPAVDNGYPIGSLSVSFY